MKKLTIALLIAIMVIGMSTAAYGQGRGGHGKGRGGHGMGGHPLLKANWDKIVEVADEAGITEDQLDALSTLRSDFRDATGDLQVDIRNKREDMKEMMATATASDKSKVLKLADELHEMQGQMMRHGITATFEIKQIFSEEQLDKLKDIAQERRRERKSQRQNKRRGGGQGQGRRMHGQGNNW